MAGWGAAGCSGPVALALVCSTPAGGWLAGCICKACGAPALLPHSSSPPIPGCTPPHHTQAGHAHISQDDSVAWRPVVKRQAFPREGPGMRWAPVQQALVTAMAPMLTDNFG